MLELHPPDQVDADAPERVRARPQVDPPPPLDQASESAEGEALLRLVTPSSCLHAFTAERSWGGGVDVVLRRVQTRLSAWRVSLAWRRGRYFTLLHWSEVTPIDEGVGVVELEAAATEAASWPHAASFPEQQDPDGALHGRMAHQRLFTSQGLTGVLSAPVRDQHGQVCAVIVCERIPMVGQDVNQQDRAVSSGAFSKCECDWLQELAALIGPSLSLRRALELPWYLRGWSWVDHAIERLGDPRERMLRGGVLAFFGVCAFLMGWPMPYTMTVPARLVARSQSAVVAPVDAALEQLSVGEGDLVRAGQPIGRLSLDSARARSLALSQLLAEQERRLQDAMAINDLAGATRWRVQVTELRNRLDADLLASRDLVLRAPFDGVVVAVADHGKVGAVLQRGDAVVMLAPGTDWRAVLEVDEAEVAQLQPGQRGEMRLMGVPDRPVQLVVQRILPVASEDGPDLHFDVEVQSVGGAVAGLRPGMRGYAHVEMAPKALLHRWVDRLRAWMWLNWWGWW